MPIPSELKDRLAEGGYARKQFFCKSRIIAWSHTSRFELVRRVVEPFAGRRLLDYGCGDGSFLTLVHDLFPDATGADLDEKQNEDCRRRFADWPVVNVLHTPALADPQYERAFDVITCMEVLEHCPPASVTAILTDLRRLLAPGGAVVVTVPIEVGPTLLGKEILRTIAGWRRLGDYRTKEKYRPGELARMVFAGEATAIERPAYPFEYAPGQFAQSHGHKGFNWKALRRRIAEDFAIERTRFSPLGWTGGLLSSQALFVCRPKG